MKLAFIDVETGGLNPKKSALLQIGCIIEIDGEIEEELVYNIQPHMSDEVDPKALAVNNLTPQQIETFQKPFDVYTMFCGVMEQYVNKFDKTDKFHFVGYNSQAFDSPFIREFFFKCKDKFYGSWFFHPTIDVMLLAAQSLIKTRHQMKDFKLSTVAQALGVEFDPTQLHDAMYDIKVTREVYRRL